MLIRVKWTAESARNSPSSFAFCFVVVFLFNIAPHDFDAGKLNSSAFLDKILVDILGALIVERTGLLMREKEFPVNILALPGTERFRVHFEHLSFPFFLFLIGGASTVLCVLGVSSTHPMACSSPLFANQNFSPKTKFSRPCFSRFSKFCVAAGSEFFCCVRCFVSSSRISFFSFLCGTNTHACGRLLIFTRVSFLRDDVRPTEKQKMLRVGKWRESSVDSETTQKKFPVIETPAHTASRLMLAHKSPRGNSS